jgi:uncharacterized protein involved in outer membrane biogenesis
MKRGILIGGVAIIGIIVAAVLFLFSNLDGIIKEAVEKYGSEFTEAKVELNEVELSITSGKGALRGFTVGNPKGFQTDSAMKLGEVSIEVDPNSVTSDPIVIKQILIAGPEITYELGDGGSNIDVLQANVQKHVGGAGGGKSAQPAAKKEEKPAADGEQEEGPKLIIENLIIRDGKVSVSAAFLKGKKLGAPLPTIHLKDIGKDGKGATPAEIADKVFTAIKNAATDSVKVLDLGKLQDLAKGGTDAAKKALEGVTSGGAKGVEGATDKLKGLFGK